MLHMSDFIKSVFVDALNVQFECLMDYVISLVVYMQIMSC